MDYLNFFFGIIKDTLNLYNIDLFGLGFTLLEFFLGGLLIIFILRFLLNSFNTMDHNNFFSLVGGRKLTLKRISDNAREQQLVTTADPNAFYRKHGYPPSGFVDVWGDGTNIIASDDYYD